MDLSQTPILPSISAPEMGLRLCMALAGGLLVNVIYKKTRPATQVNPSFPPTIVLLAVLIGMVTQVIGNNVARAFSLVGALSIVRFRTVVRDTQDTAFVIFAVVIGMAAGAGSYSIAILGLIVGAVAAFIARPNYNSSWSDSGSALSLRLGLGADPRTLLAPTLDQHLSRYEILSVTTVRQGAAIDYLYRVYLKPEASPASLVKDLNTVEGVQNVELKRGETESN